MPAPSGIRDHVLEAKQRLAEGRAKLLKRHRDGVPGIQICNAQTDLLDAIVVGLFERAVADLGVTATEGLADDVALVAHGGYGRRDVAPFSDVDLMILHAPSCTGRVAPLAKRMLSDVFDVGLVLGQSVRTPQQAAQLARKDPVIATSLAESRRLVGSEELFDRFMQSYRAQTKRRRNAWLTMVERSRASERAQYGETVYMLEPNVKRSRGGLRDIQFLRWIGFANYGTPHFDDLRLRGVLAREDYDALMRAWEFLLRLRNEMHFRAGKSRDVLDRAEQVRVAELFGFTGTAGLLPVEQFMREYFRHTNGVSNITTRFLANARREPRWTELLSPLVSHQFEGDYRVGPNQIAANQQGLEKMRGDLSQILRLADLANLYNKPIAHATCEAIRAAVPDLGEFVSPEASSRFRSLLGQPARLGELLRELHEMGVLEKVIPEFAHARCLLQFNEYHKYTVDEHSLLAVDRAAALLHDPGPLGRVYRRVKNKWLLHLALLIHDLGKGLPEDHSEVGREIAERTAERLGLSDQDRQTLVFLVHKHLVMSHLAFRRDTSDERLVVNFAVEVGSPERMQLLYLLTAADLAAVGPGVLNAWKVEVLTQLYQRAMQHLAGDTPAIYSETALEARRDAVAVLLNDQSSRSWYAKQLAALPAPYLFAASPQAVANDLCHLRSLKPGQALALAEYHAETNVVEYKVGTYEQIVPGVFHRLAGALAGRGLQVLSAEINTLEDGLIFDRFIVLDPDYQGEPPPERLEAVCRALSDSLESPSDERPAFRRVWGEPEPTAIVSRQPTRVEIDNNTSERYTIVDVFATDQVGLLYTISRTLFELDLSVSVARIGTYLDQVVDVFYVTDAKNQQIEDAHRTGEVCSRLLAAIGQLEAT